MRGGTLRRLAQLMCKSSDAAIVQNTLAEMAEDLTGLPPGTIEPHRDTDDELGARLLCLECAAGEDIELVPHEDSYCCLKHGRWTGPEPRGDNSRGGSYSTPQRAPWSSSRVGQEVLDADEMYRSLWAEGRAVSGLVRELVDIVDQTDGRKTAGLPTPANYVTVVRLLDLLSDRAFHRELFDPMITYRAAAVLLEERISAAVPGASEELVEQVWLLLRPGFLVVREHLEGAHPGSAGVIDVAVDDVLEGRRPHRPLEPFWRAMSQTDPRDWGAWCQRHLLPGQTHTVRRALTGAHQRHEFICADGHRYRTPPSVVSEAVKRGNSGCPHCAGRTALAGVNSMAETHPWLAQQWHPTFNEDVKPNQVMGASTRPYRWLCSAGHAWQSSANNRSNGRGCPYCSGHRVITGKNSLDVTHPALAAEWDFIANGDITPSMVKVNSSVNAAWICPLGHRYRARVPARTRRGSACPICQNRSVLAGFNDLATTHPEVAANWDHDRNEGVAPSDVVAGSIAKRHWRCPQGHRYIAPTKTQASGAGCPICAGRTVVAGLNDLATTHPATAEQWHPTRNGDLTPFDVVANTEREVYWLCSRGHEYAQRVVTRSRSSACLVCSGRRVLSGFNDLATRYPEIVLDWHPRKNAPVQPSEIFPGNKPRWWLCRNSHEQHRNVPTRVLTGGCSICPPDERVAEPQYKTRPRSTRFLTDDG